MHDYSNCIDLDIGIVKQYLLSVNPESHIFVGCDSTTNKENTITTFSRVVVIRRFTGNISDGCKIFGEKFIEPCYGVNYMPVRLLQEAQYAAEIAEEIRDVAENRFDVFEVHLDLNRDEAHKSNSVVAQATGYIKALGLTPKIKPFAPGASAGAHKFATILHRLDTSAA